MRNLHKDIVSNYSNYDPALVEELTFLVRQYDLRWLVFKGKVYFIMCHIALAKGLSIRNYQHYWTKRNLPGTFTKIEGLELKEFKNLYKEKYSTKLLKSTAIYIGDYIQAYHYIKANTCANTPRMHFIEMDIEELYQSTFGGERQLKLDSVRVDVINEDEVIEIKKDTVDCNAIGQLLRYLNSSNRVKGRLVAPSITADAINLLKVLNSSGYSLKYITVDVKKESA